MLSLSTDRYPPPATRGHRFKSRIIAALCGAALLLSGCSALRIGYSQAADLAYWWLDGYADFDGEQTRRVRDALAQWFAWHRKTQLPDYAQLLVRAQAEVRADTTPARACEWQAELLKRAHIAWEQAMPAAAEWALSVTPQQIQHIERRYAKVNTEFRDDYLQEDPRERTEATIKRAVERAESLYGRLDATQRARVAAAMARSPFDPELWLAERKLRQQDALQLLRRLGAEGASREQAQGALRDYVEQLERSPRETYRRYSERLAEFNCAFAATLHNSISPAQRRTALNKLSGWEGDVRALATQTFN
ncbi:MAG: DUF6279 family lipoprotein [Burkholderiaceae bacterium]